MPPTDRAVLAPPAPLSGSPKGAKMDLLGQKGTDMLEWLPWLYQMDPLVLCVYLFNLINCVIQVNGFAVNVLWTWVVMIRR